MILLIFCRIGVKFDSRMFSSLDILNPSNFIQFVIMKPKSTISLGGGPSRLPILNEAVFFVIGNKP